MKPPLWSFFHLIDKRHIALVPLRCSAPTELLGEPQVNPKILRAHLCRGPGEYVSLSRWETLWVFWTVCWRFFSQLQFVTIKWQWKRISQYHTKSGTRRAAVAAKSFSDNSHATSEGQFCTFSSPAGARFLHNRDLILAEHFHPVFSAKLRRKMIESSSNEEPYLFNIFNLTQNFVLWATLSLTKMKLILLWAAGWMKWSVLTRIIPRSSNTGNF